MTTTLEPTARCLACDTPVYSLCKDGVARHLECTASPIGEFAMIAGRLQELPVGGMVARGVMRFADHARHCKASLRPTPETVPTRPTGVWNRDRKP